MFDYIDSTDDILDNNPFESSQLKSCGVHLQFVSHMLKNLKEDIEFEEEKGFRGREWAEDIDDIVAYGAKTSACTLMSSFLDGAIAILSNLDRAFIEEDAKYQQQLLCNRKQLTDRGSSDE